MAEVAHSVGDPDSPITYMHPAYWAPHAVGDGDAELVAHDAPSDREYREALRVIGEYRGGDGNGFALDSFMPGADFDVTDLEPGTLLGVDAEYLYTGRDVVIDTESFDGVVPPGREAQYWPRIEPVSLRDQVAYYLSFASGTVVVGGKRSNPPRAVGTFFDASGGAVGEHPFIYHPSQFTVGEVHHEVFDAKDPLGNRQRLSRIHRVDILAPGKVEKAKSKVFDLGLVRRALGQGA